MAWFSSLSPTLPWPSNNFLNFLYQLEKAQQPQEWSHPEGMQVSKYTNQIKLNLSRVYFSIPLLWLAVPSIS